MRRVLVARVLRLDLNAIAPDEVTSQIALRIQLESTTAFDPGLRPGL
jgi:hypothetical protein